MYICKTANSSFPLMLLCAEWYKHVNVHFGIIVQFIKHYVKKSYEPHALISRQRHKTRRRKLLIHADKSVQLLSECFRLSICFLNMFIEISIYIWSDNASHATYLHTDKFPRDFVLIVIVLLSGCRIVWLMCVKRWLEILLCMAINFWGPICRRLPKIG